MVKIQISSDKKMGKVKTMVLPAKRNSDKTTTKKSNKLALTTESKSYIKKAKSIYWGTPLNIYIPLMKAGYYDPCPAFATFDGLAIDWVKKQKLFVNPPFGKAMDAFCHWLFRCHTIFNVIPFRFSCHFEFVCSFRCCNKLICTVLVRLFLVDTLRSANSFQR